MRRRGVSTLSRWVWTRAKRLRRRLPRKAKKLTRQVAHKLNPVEIRRRRRVGWRRLTSAFTMRRFVFLVVGLLAAALSVSGFVSLVRGEPWGPVLRWATDNCQGGNYGCNVVSHFLFTWLALAVGFWSFLLFRYTSTRRAYVRFARRRPRDLVETAGGIVGNVVGRDALCDILQEDLRDQSSRQPHVLIGGLGIGKTAVLVQLTGLLAQRGAVPVPVRLRDADDRIDFLELARRRFTAVLGSRARSPQEVDRVWHELRRDDRIVVLADGLEEAFADSETYDRDNRVRAAVSEAAEQRFPLIIASRPHEALRALNAAKIHLEPLSQEVALEYIEGDELNIDEPRLHWVVEKADVTDTPMYLQIARELQAENLLEHHFVDTRAADRVPLRLRLMKAWIGALVRGKLHETEHITLTEVQRRATIWHLEALACMGLRYDTQQVDLTKHWIHADDIVSADVGIAEAEAARRRAEADLKLAEDAGEADARAAAEAALDAAEAAREAAVGVRATHVEALAEAWHGWAGTGASSDRARAIRRLDADVVGLLHAKVVDSLNRLVDSEGRHISEVFDMQAAASRGIQLRLVDHVVNGVRFPHSIMEAYLGSRMMRTALRVEQGAYLDHALRDPGRELLLALVMFVRSTDPEGEVADQDMRATILGKLRRATGVQLTEIDLPRTGAASLKEAKLLDVMATAIEVALAIELADRDRHEELPGHYAGMVQTAEDLTITWPEIKSEDDAAWTGKSNAIARLGDAAELLREPGALHRTRADGLYRCLYRIAREENLYALRLAAAQRIGNGGDVAWKEVSQYFDVESRTEEQWRAVLQLDDQRQRAAQAATAGEPGRPPPPDVAGRPPAPHDPEPRAEPSGEREFVLQAWLLPLLLGSAEMHRAEARHALERWVGFVGKRGSPLPLSIEAALAQGFKHAANRKPYHSHEHAESRAVLQQLASKMLHRARFWYSRLTLLHALCLWELARTEMPGHAGHDRPDGGDPVALIERWLRRTGAATPRRADKDERERAGRREAEEGRAERHPFVLKAADLVLAALRTGNPERYIWIDESGVVSKIGSHSQSHGPHGKRRLWIPQSAGWIGLDRRAQQLVADVQLLLNLAERGDVAEAREDRLHQTNGNRLPVCLTGQRCAHLKPSQTVGMADLPDAGEDCARHCQVNLCPYPPRGQQPYRVELSEAFCRHQAALIRGPRPRGTWQQAPTPELRRFWREMEERARR